MDRISWPVPAKLENVFIVKIRKSIPTPVYYLPLRRRCLASQGNISSAGWPYKILATCSAATAVPFCGSSHIIRGRLKGSYKRPATSSRSLNAPDHVLDLLWASFPATATVFVSGDQGQFAHGHSDVVTK